MPRTAPTTRNHPAPNVNCAKVKNPYFNESSGRYQIYSKRDVSLQALSPSVLALWVSPISELLRASTCPSTLQQLSKPFTVTTTYQVFYCGDRWENACFPCFIFACLHFLNFEIYLDNTSPFQHTCLGNHLLLK